MNVEPQTLQSFESSRRYIGKQYRVLANYVTCWGKASLYRPGKQNGENRLGDVILW